MYGPKKVLLTRIDSGISNSKYNDTIKYSVTFRAMLTVISCVAICYCAKNVNTDCSQYEQVFQNTNFSTQQFTRTKFTMTVKVDVEYCGVCNFQKQCSDLAATINEKCPDAQVTCTVGRRGSFEVRINDELVHSKLANLAFPVNEDVVNNVIKAKDGLPLTKVKEQPITDCVIQ